ncbi:MAG: L,D-transpeptidase family protein [Pseudomonadota bacterium]
MNSRLRLWPVILLTVLAVGLGPATASADFLKYLTEGPRLRILKGRQVLELLVNGMRMKSYRVCMGLEPSGPKNVVGDLKTPEGEYFICLKNTESSFHKFLGISYPGERDAQRAYEAGMISRDTRDLVVRCSAGGKRPPWDTRLGGWVGIHGYPTEENHRMWVALLFPKPHNWTDGCIAMWNYEIDEIWPMVNVGTPVTILP